MPPRRAEPPRIPAPTADLLVAEAEHAAYLRTREAQERRSVSRGLVWLAALALVLSIARAGLDRVFPHGWFHR